MSEYRRIRYGLIFDIIADSLWHTDTRFWLWLNGGKSGCFTSLYYDIFTYIVDVLEHIRDMCFGGYMSDHAFWHNTYDDISDRVLDGRVL